MNWLRYELLHTRRKIDLLFSNTAFNFALIPIRITIFLRESNSAGKDMEKLEHLNIANSNVIWYSWETVCWFLENLNRIIKWSSNSTSRMYSYDWKQRLKYLCCFGVVVKPKAQSYLYTHVHSCISQKAKR